MSPSLVQSQNSCSCKSYLDDTQSQIVFNVVEEQSNLYDTGKYPAGK